jgi:hypothetical protein
MDLAEKNLIALGEVIETNLAIAILALSASFVVRERVKVNLRISRVHDLDACGALDARGSCFEDHFGE